MRVTYTQDHPQLDLKANRNSAYPPKEVNGNNPTDTRKDNIEQGLRAADVTLDATYPTPFEHHNPMQYYSVKTFS